MEKPLQNQYQDSQGPGPGPVVGTGIWTSTATATGPQWRNQQYYQHQYQDQNLEREREQEQIPEDPKERWRRHWRYTLSIREEKHVFKRFIQNLKVFLLDCWLDIVTVLITIAVAAAVSPVFFGLVIGLYHVVGDHADSMTRYG